MTQTKKKVKKCSAGLLFETFQCLNFTPPRKKSKQIVPDSDEYSPSEYGNYNDDESVDDDDVKFRTPKRIYQTDWKVVQKWTLMEHQRVTARN